MDMNQLSLRTDVTSLLVFDSYLMSGMGGTLSVFNLKSTEFMEKLEVFHYYRIHGISKGFDNHFAVFGGRAIAVLHFNPEMMNKLTMKNTWLVHDWIHSVQWLQDSFISVVTAHNIVMLWNWRKKEKVVTAQSEEKCILYCALLIGNSWDQLIILGGTVFSEVIIWSPAEAKSADLSASVLQRLRGHKGVIFSIHFNPKNGRIHTTSDDRSVRGWLVNFSRPDDWKNAKIDLLYTLYGHSARVWKSLGLQNFTISVGEDSLICVWNTEGKLMKHWSMHQGGSIWSLASSDENKFVVTGGSDGGINLLSLDMCMKHQDIFHIPLHEWCSGQISEQCVPRRVVVLRSGHLITILESGHLVFCSGEREKLTSIKQLYLSETAHADNFYSSSHSAVEVSLLPWTVAYYCPKLASYCLLEISQCRQFIALASLDGRLLIFKESSRCFSDSPLLKMVDICAAHGKIYSLKWLSSTSILTCESLGKMTLWSLNTTQDTGCQLVKIKTFILPISKERWVTAAFRFEEFLICGDRLGSIHLYSLGTNICEDIEPCHSLFKVHGRLGVSSIMSHCNLIYSTGRDGTLRQYTIMRNGNTLQLLCATRMLFDWVSSVCTYASDILVLGFSEKKFVIWSQQQQRLLFEVSCGGGHRSWDYFIEKNLLTFVHIKHKSLFVAFCDLALILKPLMQTGFHPKEVNCLQNLYTGKKFPLLLSGGEDTTIRVTAADSLTNFHTIVVLHSHISSVKAITYHQLNENKTLMFSAGGRAQIKAWELTYDSASDDIPTILCRELSSHMLMSQKQTKSWKDVQLNIDPETRYMSLCIIPHDQIFIAIGCSDGYFRLFQFSVDHLFKLLGTFEFHHRCILNVASIAPLKIATMATDGIIAFWNLEHVINKHLIAKENDDDRDNLSPFSTFKVHQSGINCYDFKKLESNHVLMVTGGDDTALVLSVFKLLDNPASAYKVQQWRMESAHVAQITGVAFVNNYLVSTSIDQFIFIWEWICDVSLHLLLVNKVKDYYSTISDIHGITVWPTKNGFTLCVYGNGMEIVEFSTSDIKK